MSVFRYILDSTHRTLIGLVVLVSLLGIGYANAATSYDVYNVPDMFLNVGITGTATTGITIAAPIRNSATVTYPVLTGGILKIQQGIREELVYYATATVNSTTKIITLAGVVRGVCWNQTTSIASCESGKIFSKGASVRLIDAGQLFNLKMNIDRTNTGTGIFQIRTAQTTQPWLFPNAVTTSQSTSFARGKGSTDYHIIFDTTLGVMKYWNGSAYINFGSGSTVNASDSVAGKAQITTQAKLETLASTGSTGAQNVITPRYIVRNGTGATSANKIPLLDKNGLLPITMGGAGTGSAMGIATGSILVFQGTSAPRPLYPTAVNNVITTTNGRTWISGQASSIVASIKGNGTTTGASLQAEVTMGQLTLSSALLTVGRVINIHAAGFVNMSTGAATFKLYVDGKVLGIQTGLSGTNQFTVNASLMIQSTGAGTMSTDSVLTFAPANGVTVISNWTNSGAVVTPQNITTTSDRLVKMTAQYTAASANNAATLTRFEISTQ